jgi:hypothetical protein
VETLRLPGQGIELNAVATGPRDGKLVFLLHGFPQFWWAWLRHRPRFEARQIAKPIRIIWGDRDFALAARLAEAGQALCDHAEVFHLPDATHWPLREPRLASGGISIAGLDCGVRLLADQPILLSARPRALRASPYLLVLVHNPIKPRRQVSVSREASVFGRAAALRIAARCIGTALQQEFDHGFVSGGRRDHQRRHAVRPSKAVRSPAAGRSFSSAATSPHPAAARSSASREYVILSCLFAYTRIASAARPSASRQLATISVECDQRRM